MADSEGALTGAIRATLARFEREIRVGVRDDTSREDTVCVVASAHHIRSQPRQSQADNSGSGTKMAVRANERATCQHSGMSGGR